jgi:hypothetical protein
MSNKLTCVNLRKLLVILLAMCILKWMKFAHGKIRPTSNRVAKHVSTEIDSWKPSRDGKRFRGCQWSTNISLDTDTLYKRRTELISDQLKLQRLQNKVLRTTGNFLRRTPVRDLHMASKLPYIYDYITKLCRQQAEVIQNHANGNFRNIGQGEPRERKYMRLTLGGGQAYGRSSEDCRCSRRY